MKRFSLQKILSTICRPANGTNSVLRYFECETNFTQMNIKEMKQADKLLMLLTKWESSKRSAK